MRHRLTAMVECSTDLLKIDNLATDVLYNGIESKVTRFIFRQSSRKSVYTICNAICIDRVAIITRVVTGDLYIGHARVPIGIALINGIVECSLLTLILSNDGFEVR